MRILFLTQYYAPEPAEKIVDLARRLCALGHEVQVITGFPCYPHGKTYSGFRQRLSSVEMHDGVRVTRVPQFPDHSRSIVLRALYYVSFALSAATIGLARSRKADVVLVYQSALPIGLAAWVISRVKRVPYVLDVVDLWPESVAASGMLTHRFALSLIRRVAQFVYRGAAGINVITEGYRQNLLSLGVPAGKLRLIHCWSPDAGSPSLAAGGDEEFAQREGLAGRFNVLYTGAIGPCQHLETVLEAALHLQDEPRVQFVIAGEGVERAMLERRAQSAGIANVRFCGWRSPADAARLQAAADVLLVHLKPDAMSRISIPSKTFSYMAAGKPILMAVEGEASDLIRTYRCGYVASPSDPAALASTIRQCVHDSDADRQALGARGRQAYERHFSPDVQVDKVVDSLDRVVGRTAAPQRSLYQRHAKRWLDLAIALPALIILAPVLAAIALLVRLKLGSPVIFKQVRPGRDARPFTLVKFRTMTDQRDADGDLLPDAQRLTRFGRFLRSTSLDELPELWNVVRGDMSLVGPRPLLVEYLPLFSARQSLRHDVRPGLTGWAQVNGRNDLPWNEKLELDAWYADRVTLGLDLRILLRTAFSVLGRQGVAKHGHATSDKFTGAVASNAPQPKSAIVLGAGGHAKIVISTLQAAGWSVEAAYDDDPSKHGTRIGGVEVRGSLASLPPDDSRPAIIAVGDNERREEIARRTPCRWISVIHPAAWVDPTATMGDGTVVCAGAVVQADCRIGRHVIVNTSASIDHDCDIGDGVHIGPGAVLTGGVRVESCALVGAAAVVLPGRNVGSRSLVGAGSVVVHDLPADVVAVGQPAAALSNRSPQHRAA